MASFILPTLYLFDNVFYPSTVIPLIISDNPSKALINACYQEDLPLALWFNAENSKPVATMGKILSIETKPDNTFKVLIRGIRRVHLNKQVQHLPYPIFHGELFNDIEEGIIKNFSRLEKMHLLLNEWLKIHIQHEKDRKDFLNELNTAHKLCDHVALLMIKDVEIKQIILESTSLQERLQLLDTLIRSPFEKEDPIVAIAIKKFEKLDLVSGLQN